MKRLVYIVLILLISSSCSSNDEPAPDVFTQVTKISNGDNDTKSITYDSYGRVAKYIITFNEYNVVATYSYPSDDLIRIHTEETIIWDINYSTTRSYDDEVYMDNGRAVYCEGIFSTDEFGTIFQKKLLLSDKSF